MSIIFCIFAVVFWKSLNTTNMTKSIRHSILLLAAISLFAACEDRAIPSDTLGTDGIQQGVIAYDTIKNMRELMPADTLAEPENPIDTIAVDMAVQYGLDSIPVGETSAQYFYVLGAVKGFSATYDATYGNITPIIVNKLNNRQMICYRMKGLNNQNFTDANQLQIGDIVVVRGQIQNRYGTPQLTQGCYLVTSSNPESGYKPSPRVVLNITFNNNIGAFTVDTKKEASEEVWLHNAPDGSKPGFMKATANINKVNEEAESWLVSPARDLTVCKRGAILTFSHYCLGTSDDVEQLIRVLVRKEGGEWQQLTIPEDMWNNPKLKRFTSVSIDLADYISPATQIAFAYKSTTDNAHTWAVQNVRISEPAEESAEE